MMPDREKVIKCVTNAIQIEKRNEKALVYLRVSDAKDILTMLKEQEAVKVQYTAMGGLRYGACPQCDARIDNLVNPKACGFCGQAVKWE